MQLGSPCCLQMSGADTIITNPINGQEKAFTFDYSYWQGLSVWNIAELVRRVLGCRDQGLSSTLPLSAHLHCLVCIRTVSAPAAAAMCCPMRPRPASGVRQY